MAFLRVEGNAAHIAAERERDIRLAHRHVGQLGSGRRAARRGTARGPGPPWRGARRATVKLATPQPCPRLRQRTNPPSSVLTVAPSRREPRKVTARGHTRSRRISVKSAREDWRASREPVLHGRRAAYSGWGTSSPSWMISRSQGRMMNLSVSKAWKSGVGAGLERDGGADLGGLEQAHLVQGQLHGAAGVAGLVHQQHAAAADRWRAGRPPAPASSSARWPGDRHGGELALQDGGDHDAGNDAGLGDAEHDFRLDTRRATLRASARQTSPKKAQSTSITSRAIRRRRIAFAAWSQATPARPGAGQPRLRPSQNLGLSCEDTTT